MFRIRRFGVLRTANIAALVYLVAVAILVVPFILFMFALGGARGMPPFAAGAALGGAIAALIIYPVLGWVFTAIACLIYNFVARWAGGIEVDVERVQPAGYAPYGYPYGGTSGPTTPPPYGGQGQYQGMGQRQPYDPAPAAPPAPWSSDAGQKPSAPPSERPPTPPPGSSSSGQG